MYIMLYHVYIYVHIRQKEENRIVRVKVGKERMNNTKNM